MRLKDTTIPSELQSTLAVNNKLDWDPLDTEPIFMCIFVSIAKFLGINKSKESGKVALRFDDYKGNMMMAAIVTYTPNENASMPGNWSLTFTFDPEDIKGINPTLNSNDMSFHMINNQVTLKLIGYSYNDISYEDGIVRGCIETLRACLDKNATPEGRFDIELKDYFTASVSIEDGHKVMAIEPTAKLSQIVKGDADIEV